MPPVLGTTKPDQTAHQQRQHQQQRAGADLDVVHLIEQLTQLSTELSKKYEDLNAREAVLTARERLLNEREANLLKTVQHLVKSQIEREAVLRAELADLQDGEGSVVDASPLGTDADVPPPVAPRIPPIHMAFETRDRGDSRSAPRSADRGVSPSHYEGPVDPSVPSHVEEIVDEDDAGEQKPRGLRSSPQFQPMDPNDSGRNFLRRGHGKRDEGGRRKPLRYDEEQDVDDDFYDDSDDVENDVADEEHGDDEESEGLDDVDPALFDEAVAYLTNSGLVSVAQIRQWLGEGAHPSQIVELYLREARGEMEGVEDDEGAYEENDDDDDIGYGDEGDGQENNDEDFPLTADTGAIKATDEADTPPRIDRVDGMALAAARVRGTSSPQVTAKHLAYNSFDESSSSSSGGDGDDHAAQDQS